MTALKCPECGTPVDSDDEFYACPKCGNEFEWCDTLSDEEYARQAGEIADLLGPLLDANRDNPTASAIARGLDAARRPPK